MGKKIAMEESRKIEVTYPIRIAQVMGKLWAGGVEAVVFNYYREIDKTKFQFDFYYDADSTVEPPQSLIDMGAHFYKIPPYQDLHNYLRTLIKEFKKHKYIIVHSHINTLSVFPLYAAKKAGVPIRIAHNHSVPGGNELKRNVAKNILKHFAKIYANQYFACSEKAGRWLYGNKTFDQGKVFIMKNAINFLLYQRQPEEIAELKEKLGLEDKFVVGHVGRFTFAKNHAFLLDVFAEICKKRNNAVLLLVGDGELHDEIVNKIRELKLTSNVVLTGKVRDPYRYYSLMDVLILPSVFEGLSMTTIEAQAAGKNILISSAIPVEAVISNGCHYMSDKAMAIEWANKALTVADRPVAYTGAKDDYSIDTAVKKLEKQYMIHLSKANKIIY